jgi:hypothetical protein
MQIRIALVIVLAGAAAVGGLASADRFTFGLLAFGIVNVIFSPPGTTWVRGAAVAASVLALASPGSVRTLLILLAWLVWPPAFMVAWAIARQAAAPGDETSGEGPAAGRRARIAVSVVIAAVACASLAYRVILAQGLQQTAALFVGLPALLAIVVVLGVSPRSATGVACKAVTVGLLVSLLFLGEGIVCVVMSAPLFYAVAVLIGLASGAARRGFGKPAHTTFTSLAVLALVPMSLEGVTDFTSLNRDEEVTETRVVYAPAHAVGRAIFEPPRFDRALPLYLAAGFPRPTSTRIERAAAVRWVIRLRGGEMRIDGIEPRAGDLILVLEESRPGRVRWRAVADDSHMTHFLSWREAIVQWESVDAHATKVTWTLRYRRGLDPSWYFGPWERYAARLAAGYLIDSVATP